MRSYCYFLFFVLPLSAASQDDEGRNYRPEITGQREIDIDEDQPVEIRLTDLYVRDYDDWWYPAGFTLRVYDGEHYKVRDNVVTPDNNYHGTLSVPVTVNDGEDESKKYDLRIEVEPVNDVPVIKGQENVNTAEEEPVTIHLSDLSVTDPDDDYPDDFDLVILPPETGSYSVSGNTIIPAPGFQGVLAVPLMVNDGHDYSPVYDFIIPVLPGNRAPVIVDQHPASIQEDESFTLEFAHLIVDDPDNEYPDDFTLRILSGSGYDFSGAVVQPDADRSGDLVVNIVVNDGHRDSNTYPFRLFVRPVNDPPRIAEFETSVIDYRPGDDPVSLTDIISISDPDDDSLSGAVIAFRPDKYRPGADRLDFDNATGRISADFDVIRGVLRFSGPAPVSHYAAALRAVRYNFVRASGFIFENKSVSITVSDGKADSEKVERFIGGREVSVSLEIPTAFTPNGDSANDTWKIKPLESSEELSKAVVRVYNEGGYLLYESVGFEKEWDGKHDGRILPAGAYFYTIDLNLGSYSRSFKGIIAILR